MRLNKPSSLSFSSFLLCPSSRSSCSSTGLPMVCQCLSHLEEPKTEGPILDTVSRFRNRREGSLPWTCWLHSFQSMWLGFFAAKAHCSTLGSSTRNPRSFLQSCFLASQPYLYSCWSYSIKCGGFFFYLILLNFTFPTSSFLQPKQ